MFVTQKNLKMKSIPYYHVDVFANQPLAGNGLTVFTAAEGLSKAVMLKLTQEMRQFESIFLEKTGVSTVKASIFTCEEELDFAGHPVLGSAATLHDLYHPDEPGSNWTFLLNKKTVEVTVEKRGHSCYATMDQGTAEFGRVLTAGETAWLLESISLDPDDLYPGLYPTVVSTGLPYLIIPLQQNVFRAKIKITDLTEKIAAFGAHFIGVLEIPSQRIRSGDNGGHVEDIATGSLAGPAGAYLVKHGFQQAGLEFQINQGENLGRPSQLFVAVNTMENGLNVQVSGGVHKVSQSVLDPVLSAYLHEL